MGLLFSLFNVVWNNAFEDEPSGGDSPSYGDDEIRTLKEAVRERFEKEHKMNLTSGVASADGTHKAGTVKVYYSADEPTVQPDGITALNVNDNGRIWVRSTDLRLSFYVHPSWVRATTNNALDNTFTSVNTFNGNLRIPTSEPASLSDGDIWIA